MVSTTFSSTTSSPTSTATESCITVTPGKDGYVPEWACNSNYMYSPSFAAALLFAIIFGLTTFAHIYQAIAYKRIRLCWTIIMGAIWEFASFAIRTAGTKDQQSTGMATSSQILLLLAPMWVNAFDYMVVGRMIYYFVPEKQIWGLKGVNITKVFVWLDIASFITQAAGGVMITPDSSPSVQMTGIHIYMGGIGLQELCILVFFGITIRFFFVMRRYEGSNQVLDMPRRNWRPLLYVIYASLALITVRIIFRLVEFSAGMDPDKNPIPFHEAYFMALDALPMFIALVIMNVIHPGRILTGEGSEFPKGPTRKEKKAAKRAKKEAKATAKAEKKMMKEQAKKKGDGAEEYAQLEEYV